MIRSTGRVMIGCVLSSLWLYVDLSVGAVECSNLLKDDRGSTSNTISGAVCVEICSEVSVCSGNDPDQFMQCAHQESEQSYGDAYRYGRNSKLLSMNDENVREARKTRAEELYHTLRRQYMNTSADRGKAGFREGGQADLAWLRQCVRLHDEGIAFDMFSPSQLFSAAKGNGDFDKVLAEAYILNLIHCRSREDLRLALAYYVPEYIGMIPLEWKIATAEAPIDYSVLFDVWHGTRRESVRSGLSVVLTRSFPQLRQLCDSNEDFVRSCEEWYHANAEHIAPNWSYEHLPNQSCSEGYGGGLFLLSGGQDCPSTEAEYRKRSVEVDLSSKSAGAAQELLLDDLVMEMPESCLETEVRRIGAKIKTGDEERIDELIVYTILKIRIWKGDVEGIQQILANCCPWGMYVEYLLASESKGRYFTAVFDAYDVCADDNCRNRLAEILRRSFSSMAEWGSDDEGFVEECRAWYDANREALEVNPHYEGIGLVSTMNADGEDEYDDEIGRKLVTPLFIISVTALPTP